MDRIQVVELTGENAITREAGRAVYALLQPRLLAGEKTVLDFAGVRVITASFFSAAIGRLYADFSPDRLSDQLTLLNLVPWGRRTLLVVIETARMQYGYPAPSRGTSNGQ